MHLKRKSGAKVMEISKQIDSLIANLNALKPYLLDDSPKNIEKFNSVLKASIERSSPLDLEKPAEDKIDNVIQVPSWVDLDYGYETAEPRKPNMREMMEALSGKSVEELYADETSNWRKQSELASELLYGVVGEKTDTRDWIKVMSSEDILTETRNATYKMHQPVIDIASQFDENDQLIYQYAVIKNSSGEILKSLNGEKKQVKSILENFAINKNSVPVDLEDRITFKNFDQSIMKLLKELPEKPAPSPANNSLETLEVLALKSHLSSIGSNPTDIIPPEELAKL